MFVLGITGGIGSGKSTVSEILRNRGLKVLDADEISREVTKAGGIAIPAIAEAFGNRAIASDGSMNRRFVSNVVFSDNTKLDLLSSIIHTHVFEYIDAEIQRERERGTNCIVLDVPIPVKTGFVSNCNQIWVVTCKESVRLNRLVERNMSLEEAKRRIAVQMSDSEYLELSDFSIDNSGDIESLHEQVNKLIVEQLVERGIRI